MRVRIVAKNLIANPAILQKEVVAPTHGMRKYSSENHPANRTSLVLRSAIAQVLEIALRADPDASDGRLTFRFYDPTINTYDKIKEILHMSMMDSIGDGIGSISSRTLKRTFSEYMAERDGSLRFSRSDPNCCPYSQDLERQCSALGMDFKALEWEVTPGADEWLLARKRSSLAVAKAVHEIQISWDRKVTNHLKELIAKLTRLEGKDVLERLRSERFGNSADECPSWRSREVRAHLTHQDDMTKPNVPLFVQDSLSDLSRYISGVTANV